MKLRNAILSFAAGRARGRRPLALHPLNQAHAVARGVREDRQRGTAWDIHWGLNSLPAELLRLVLCGLQVLDLRVDSVPTLVVLGYPAADTALAVRVYHPVVHRVVRIDVPIEQISVEAPEVLASVDLEVGHRFAYLSAL